VHDMYTSITHRYARCCVNPSRGQVIAQAAARQAARDRERTRSELGTRKFLLLSPPERYIQRQPVQYGSGQGSVSSADAAATTKNHSHIPCHMSHPLPHVYTVSYVRSFIVHKQS
jgi:hypothetical protein